MDYDDLFPEEPARRDEQPWQRRRRERLGPVERNPGGEKTLLNGFAYLRYVWQRYVKGREDAVEPPESERVFPVKSGQFIHIYRARSVRIDSRGRADIEVIYMIRDKRQLRALEEAMRGDEARFRALFQECVLEEGIEVTFNRAADSFARLARDPEAPARLSTYRKAVRSAIEIFRHYEELSGGAGLEGGGGGAAEAERAGAETTPRRALAEPKTPLFYDNSRDSLQLLEAVKATARSMRQSPYVSADDFFSPFAVMDENAYAATMAHYEVYWRRLLNDPSKSATQPQVFEIQRLLPDRSGRENPLWERLKKMLLDVDPQFILKATPIAPDTGDEVAHEIKCGYFLNELNFGYDHVLTPHFMQIADWWCTSSESIAPRTVKTFLSAEDEWEFTVAEKLNRSIGDNLTVDSGLNGLRHQLFQVFLTLEVAWLSNEYIHYDLHLGNVFTKRLTQSSALFNKNLVYKRYNNDDEWYRLEAGVLKNSLVKLLDYGRNRMYVPRPGADTLDESGIHVRHRHEQLLFYTSLEEYGVTERANRSWDLRRAMIMVLEKLTRNELAAIRQEGEAYDAFCALCDHIFRFDRLRQQLDSLGPEKDEDKAIFLRNALTPLARDTKMLLKGRDMMRDDATARNWFDLYTRLLCWSEVDTEANATSALDQHFFDALKVAEVSNSDDNVIVSFPTADLLATVLPGETEPLQAGLGNKSGARRRHLQCHVCRKRCSMRSNYQGERLPFCGQVCYQYKYHHGCRSRAY